MQPDRPECHVCHKTFKDRRGLCGHLWAKHRIKASECLEFVRGVDGKLVRLRTKLVKQIYGVDEDLDRLRDALNELGERRRFGWSEKEESLEKIFRSEYKSRRAEGMALIEELEKVEDQIGGNEKVQMELFGPVEETAVEALFSGMTVAEILGVK